MFLNNPFFEIKMDKYTIKSFFLVFFLYSSVVSVVFSAQFTVYASELKLFGSCPSIINPPLKYCAVGSGVPSSVQSNTSTRFSIPLVEFSYVNKTLFTLLPTNYTPRSPSNWLYNISSTSNNWTALQVGLERSICSSNPSCELFKIPLTGGERSFLLIPYKLNDAGYVGWTTNASLTITYYFMNISPPILTRSSSDLTCASTLTSEESSANLTANFTFYQNGAIAGFQQRNCTNATSCSVSISPSQAKDTSWLCSVSAGDWSVNSTAIVVPNNPPSISAEIWQTGNGTHKTTIHTRASDPDGAGDIVACSISAPSCSPPYLHETGIINEKECQSTCSAPESATITFTDSSGDNATTAPATISIANSPPAAPAILSPADGTVIPFNYADFVFSASTDPDGDPVSYLLFIVELARNITGIASPIRVDNLPRGNYTARLFSFDGSAYSDFSQTKFTINFNTAPNAPSIIRLDNGTILFSDSSDAEGDLITCFLFGDNSNPPTTPIYVGPCAASFLWAPSGYGTFYFHALASDGRANSTFSDVGNFTVLPSTTTTTTVPPTTITTTTIPTTSTTTTTITATTTTTSPSGGGGGPPIPPAAPKPSFNFSKARFDEKLEFTINNPTNSTLRLEYNTSVPGALSCLTKVIPANKNGTNVTCVQLKFNTNFSVTFSLVSPNGKTAGTASLSNLIFRRKERFPNLEGRILNQTNRLFFLWSNCSLSEARLRLDRLKEKSEAHKKGDTNLTFTALESELRLDELFNSTCPPFLPRNSSKSRIPTPAFTAPSSGNFLFRVWEAIRNFFLNLFSRK
jgi:hypothetical protein